MQRSLLKFGLVLAGVCVAGALAFAATLVLTHSGLAASLLERGLRRFASEAERKMASKVANTPEVGGWQLPETSMPGECYAGWQRSLVRLFPDTPAKRALAGPIDIAMAANESESFQLMLYGKEGWPKSIHVSVGALTDGERVLNPALKIYAERFVATQEPDYEVSRVGPWSDPLVPGADIELKPLSLWPAWVTIKAGLDARPGLYRGAVTVSGSGGYRREIPIQVKVYDFALPERPTYKTAFDLYFSRLASAYQQIIGPGVDVVPIFRTYVYDMLEHRVSPILNADLTNPVHLSAVLDFASRGMSAFGVGEYGGSFDNHWPLVEGRLAPRVEQQWSELDRLVTANHLEGLAYSYTLDEPPAQYPGVPEVCAELHHFAPHIKTLIATQYTPDPVKDRDWLKDVDIVCIRNLEFNPATARGLLESGKQVWLYASGPRPPYPTLVIDYPAMAYRIIPWMSFKYGASGFLYWAVNFWTVDPWTTTTNTKWGQNGNGMLYYPGIKGPDPSLRMEILRDGIEDYEYLRILSELVAKSKSWHNPGIGAAVERATEALQVDDLVKSPRDYSDDPETLERHRRALGEAIGALRHLQPGRYPARGAIPDAPRPSRASPVIGH